MNNVVLYYFKAFFRGIAQIMLQENAITGILFFIAICYDSLEMGICAAMCNIVAIIMAKLLKYDAGEIGSGLYGFNPTLIGIALIVFFEPSTAVYLTMFVATILATFLMHWALKRGLPAYTFPFVLFTWLSMYFLDATHLGVRVVSTAEKIIQESNNITILINAFAEVLLQGTFVAGLLFFVGVFISRPLQALYGFAAVIISVFIARNYEVSNTLIGAGMFSFNAVLCGIAMGEDKVRAGIYVLISVIIGTYVDIFMMDLDITTLTFPFVFAMWVMFPIKKLDEWIVSKVRGTQFHKFLNQDFK
ncbi:urea transporter [Flavobacterium agricola]|uniref:Urea transporter n=1 Tax=Flavobacterium agricola TaxID=2870839 RepID=A0ABY6M1I4_9FLAO|nr:urea transporter [Flavobacterium agricola]UYW02296.1 urea transporter [Flavobacterium agricola]